MSDTSNTQSSDGLQGTAINSTGLKKEASDVDSLIAETLSETRSSGRAGAEIAFTATPIAREFVAAPKVETIIIPQQPLPALETKAPAPKEAEKQAAEPPKDQYELTFKAYKTGDLVQGTILSIDSSGALVDIKYKSDGIVPSEELAGVSLKVGDKVDVLIESLSSKEGNVILSVKKALHERSWQTLYDSFKTKKALEVKVTSAVGGGLVVDYNGIRAFIPASHVAKAQGGQFSDLVGQTIPAKVLEIDRYRSKLIMSHRLGSIEKQQIDNEKNFDKIEVGQVLKGRVSSIKKFGVFVNVEGIEGLIHVNDLSWKRVDDPSKILSMGQEVEVFVLGIERSSRKLSLGYKQLQPDPWVSVSDKYKAGQLIDVKILRLAKFGAFAELEEGIEGLIHNSELSLSGVKEPSEAVKPGDVVKVVILRILPEEQKIGLSVREAKHLEMKQELKESQSAVQPKVTIGDAVGDSLKEQLASQNELPPSA